MAGDTGFIFELPVVLGPGISCRPDPSETQTALCPCGESCSGDRVDSTVTVLCCQSSDAFCDAEAASFHAFRVVPVEIVGDEPTRCSLAEGEPADEHVSVYEHSYCRPLTDKDQLWSKVLSLHAKILELDRREESTVAKIRALETEIAILKKDGAVFKEKQKFLEEYISTMVL